MSGENREAEVLTSQVVKQKLSQNDVFQTESDDPLESYYINLMGHDYLFQKLNQKRMDLPEYITQRKGSD